MASNKKRRRIFNLLHLAVILTAIAAAEAGILLFSGSTLCKAEEPAAITLQEIRNYSSNGILTVKQSTSNLEVIEKYVTRDVSCLFNNVTFSGVTNINVASGFGINQAGVIRVATSFKNEIPYFLPQMELVGTMSLANSRLNSSNTEYSAVISGQGLHGSGVMVINQISGNLNNQLTAVGVNLGNLSTARNPKTSMSEFVNSTSASGINAIILSAHQLKTVTATYNNTLKVAHQKASATIEEGALTNFSGICTVNQIAGNMNQVINNLNVNINTHN
ncbi:MAG: hypothetical protein ABFD50_19590 [Smithella sp.]